MDEATDWIGENGYSRVAVQLPEGLRSHAFELVRELERRTGAEVLVAADPCHGACDLPEDFRRYAQALIHFGHAEMPSLGPREDVLFVEARSTARIDDLLPEVIPLLPERVGLVATVQHLHLLGGIRTALEEAGREVHIGRGDGRIKHPGQVLGCDVTAATSVAGEVDAFLHVGSGDFHPLAVALATSTEVLVLDPLNQEVRGVEEQRERMLRQRHAAIVLSSEADRIGVLVSTKPGQMRLGLARRVEEYIESSGRSSAILVVDEVRPEDMVSFRMDALVSTACPRIALDDHARFPVPVITPVELEVVLGRRGWEDYDFDSILGDET
ncbi:MAG: diphthamide biosynthesis enzyme Dph2 [Methanomassiliicoccales archaeon]